MENNKRMVELTERFPACYLLAPLQRPEQAKMDVNSCRRMLQRIRFSVKGNE